MMALISVSAALAQRVDQSDLKLASKDVPPRWLTWAEKTDFQQTPRYAHTISYCRDLADASDWVRFGTFGVSPEDRELPLVIAAKDGDFSPDAARNHDKLVVLIQNCIHAGECAGKDASLMLLRDIAVTRQFEHLLNHVVLLVIPIYNVDGHERFGPYLRINQNGPEQMGWRTTSRNLNLNRDFMKVDAVETRAWLALWNKWQPDFHIDTHTTDGGDWQYDVLYAIDTHDAAEPHIVRWIEESYRPFVLSKMEDDGHLCLPYFWFVDGKDPIKGIRSGGFGPRFANGYVALRNRPSLLVETHMLKRYRTRVIGQYDIIRHTLEYLNEHPDTLREAIQSADSTKPGSLRGNAESKLTLTVKSTDTSEPIDFKGVAWRRELSPISGDVRIVYDGRQRVDLNTVWFNKTEPAKQVDPPRGYLIPPQWTEVIDVLEAHGLKVARLDEGAKVPVQSYRFHDVGFRERPYEGRHTVNYRAEQVQEERWFPAGSYFVSLDQRTWKVAVHLLEPDAPDSLVAWGFFNAVFEQKEYAEGYVLEQLASRMMAESDGLRQEFEQKVRSDKAFAADPHARLYWFYERSPYWDEAMNVYPVGRVATDVQLPLEQARESR
ncbi:MAG: M14 family metallopeptidase [Phycisphaerae bacterium]|nr:M14 family metallopeptidase [Phycisphaerae bacterium]